VLDLAWRYWRVLATAVSFAAFGLCCLLLGGVVFPLLNLLVWQGARRVALARNVIRLTLRGYIELMRALGVLRYELSGLEKLERGGLLILANHPTLIDTVFLMAFVKRANCVVKAALWDNPILSGPVRAAGYIRNDGGAALVADCLDSLRRGDSLIIFPEGTRTPRGGAIQFKRGAANIAVRGARDITPVLIDCQPPTLAKGDKWWRVPPRQARFTIAVQDDLPVGEFCAAGQSPVLAARQLTDHLQHFFTKRQSTHA
jgi:1-acyl-sn-glycerol-3-phosphate acyltransferase